MLYMRPYVYSRPITVYFPDFVWDFDDDLLMLVLLDKLGGEVEITKEDIDKVNNATLTGENDGDKWKLTLKKAK